MQNPKHNMSWGNLVDIMI